jgi:bifunctional DNA-binding transcriptional regulator/antitoxin component of YhaV-PrlF toxin-antitoxin module
METIGLLTLIIKEKCAMKATGIVRKVDELGRIVLPIELRRVLEIGVKDPVKYHKK